MKHFFYSFLAALALTTSANAALPPLYQTTAELKAILSDERLGQRLHSGEPISEILKNDRGYVIVTNQHRLQVNVEYKPMERPGPAQFDLDFKEAAPL